MTLSEIREAICFMLGSKRRNIWQLANEEQETETETDFAEYNTKRKDSE